MKKLSMFLFVLIVALLVFIIPETEPVEVSYKSTSIKAREFVPSFFFIAICLLCAGFIWFKLDCTS